jgi:hypothetical protein
MAKATSPACDVWRGAQSSWAAAPSLDCSWRRGHRGGNFASEASAHKKKDFKNDRVTIRLQGEEASGFDTFPVLLANVDTIADFTVVDDTIDLAKAIFSALPAFGTLSANNFRLRAAVADADDFIIYNGATGALFYDSNGSGAGGAVQPRYPRNRAGTHQQRFSRRLKG